MRLGKSAGSWIRQSSSKAALYNMERPHKQNKQLHEQSGECQLTDDMRAAQWRASGYMLRREEETLCQQVMKHYFNTPADTKKFTGRKRNTLPTVISEDIKTTSANCRLPFSKFDSAEDLRTMKSVAGDRVMWKSISNLICNHAEGNI